MNLAIIPFIFLNLFSIVVIFVIYFSLKEYSRIKNNQFSPLSLAIIFLFLFPIIFIFEYFFSFYNNLYYLSLVPILIIFFSFYFDNRFSYLIFAIFLFSWIFKVMNLEEDGSFNPVYLLPLIANLSLILIINLKEISIFSNFKNHFFALSIIFIYIFILFLFSIFFFFILDLNDFYDNPPLDFFILLLSEVIYYYFFYITIFFVIISLDAIYNNFFKLESFADQNEVSYFKITLAQDYLRDYISKNNYKYGFLILFNIDNKFLVENNDINFILEYLKLKIEKNYQDSFFLKINSNYYSVFIPFKREEIDLELIHKNSEKNNHKGDFFEKLEKILRTVKINNKNASAVVSTYGLDSCDFNQLIYDASYLLNSAIKQKNITLNLYDFRKIKDRLSRNNKISYLIETIKNYDLTYIRSNTKQKIYYPLIYLSTEESNKKINLYDWINTKKFTKKEKIIIERYFANIILKNFQNYNFDKLILNYSFNYLISNDFDRNEFLNNLKKEIELEKVVIGVFVEDKFRDPNKFIKLKHYFKELGIEFALLDLENINEDFYKILKPDWFKYYKEHNIWEILNFKNKLSEDKLKKYKIKDNLLN
ncbi:hypothetical protein X271_00030 [Candidatus Hepatoplasma crinochetorum Av]|uniref:Uncharacterized protein n=1 Tax=Candidatus Hepatoplasma crinochetorum Av TaxID=1427984 RepID=W8GRT8_9MOLU|nr:hypothetical protein [Candidatus Hepatoplasma crinochetorum]AHK22150.1 hypothetical protein X271_00030 [Candidatus Hepatoplasma crinochetorum Av]